MRARIGIGFLISLTLACHAAEQTAIDQRFHVKISYPDTWALRPANLPNEILVFFSEGGKGSAGCSVAANDTKIKTNTDESLVAIYQAVPYLLEQRLMDGFRDPQVHERKITTLSNLKAISIVSSGSYSTLGQTFRLRLWSLVTQKQGIGFTITCTDLDDRFSSSVATFQKIMSTFFLFP